MSANPQTTTAPTGSVLRRRSAHGITKIVAKSFAGLAGLPGLRDSVETAHRAFKALKPDVFQAPETNDVRAQVLIDRIDRVLALVQPLASTPNKPLDDMPEDLACDGVPETQTFVNDLNDIKVELKKTMGKKYATKFACQEELARDLASWELEIFEQMLRFCVHQSIRASQAESEFRKFEQEVKRQLEALTAGHLQWSAKIASSRAATRGATLLPELMQATRSVYALNERGEPIGTTSLKEWPGESVVITREKLRIRVRDVGRHLEHITTVGEFLCAMYDVCTVQRNLYRTPKILNKDVGWGNIMLAPSNGVFYDRYVGGRDEVKYINQILAKDRDVKPQPACLLVDLGIGADLDKTQDDPQVREGRMGTPKFMARSVLSGEPLEFRTHLSIFARMPALEMRALELYEFAYSKEHYAKFTNSLPNWSMQLVEPRAPDTKFAHQLLHNAESVFWVTSWLLACSARPGYQQELSWPGRLESFVFGMEHCPFGKIDTRAQILYQTPKDWEGVLHSSLKSLAPMLAGMGSYVFPEWTYRTELEYEPEHVHEALMRLLLNEIVRPDVKGIKLAIGIRDLPEDKNSRRRWL